VTGGGSISVSCATLGLLSDGLISKFSDSSVPSSECGAVEEEETGLVADTLGAATELRVSHHSDGTVERSVRDSVQRREDLQ